MSRSILCICCPHSGPMAYEDARYTAFDINCAVASMCCKYSSLFFQLSTGLLEKFTEDFGDNQKPCPM